MTCTTLIVIAKEPVPGQVKTRLVPPLTYDEAAGLAAAALADTLATVTATPARHRILAFAGDASRWCPRGWAYEPQPSGGLDLRIAAALGAATGPALLVGMDTPQVRPDHLLGFDATRYDAALGLAPDGGYWAIGLREPARARAAIVGVPMSTERTGHAQLNRLRELGLRVQELPPLTDVDTIESARLVATLAPRTRFAAALAGVQVPA